MTLPVPITKQELLDPEGVYCDRMRTHLRARLALVAELGCRGKIPPDKAKGYAVGVKAAAELLDRYDPKPRYQEAGDSSRPVNVAVILQAHPGAAIPANGVRLHLSSGDGENGHGGAGA